MTVDDLDTKDWFAVDRDAVAVGLETSLATARWLRDQAGLAFVSVPVIARDGCTTQRMTDRYTVSLSPFVDGESHPFGPHTDPERRRRVLDTLTALHRVTPPAGVLDLRRPTIGMRADLDAALRENSLAHADELAVRLAAFDRAVPAVAAARPVITHGEPHAANVLTVGDVDLLIDWDTLGLAVPERDLWFFIDDADGLAHYGAATGHRPDADTLALYRVRWQFDDLGHAVHSLHHPGAETERAAAVLPALLDDILATPPLRQPR